MKTIQLILYKEIIISKKVRYFQQLITTASSKYSLNFSYFFLLILCLQSSTMLLTCMVLCLRLDPLQQPM